MAERSTFFSRFTSRDQASSAASPTQCRTSVHDTRCQRPLDKRRSRREMAAATCGICLEAVSEQGVLQCRLDSGMMEQACAHAFCFTCVITWAKRTNTCPMCKARFNAVHRAPQQTARGIGETVEVENKDPIVDNESADEHLAAELAEQEGEGSAIGDSDLEDAGPLLESGTGQRRRQDMPAHGYVMDDFVVDDDEVEMEGEDESSSGSDEEWEEPSVAATAGRTRRAVAAAAAVGSRTSTRTNNSGSTPGHRHSGLLDAFAPGLDEEEEEVYFSAQTGFGRRPTGRRAATVSEAMGTIGLGPLRGEEILPDELRQLQREAARVVGGSPLRPRRRPPPRSRLPAAFTGSTPALSRRSTTATAASASTVNSPSPVGRRSEQRGASGTSSGRFSRDTERFGDEGSEEAMSRLRRGVAGSSSSPCRRLQRRRPALRSLANAHSNVQSAIGRRARRTTITADDDLNDSQDEQQMGTEWFTPAGDGEVSSLAAAETLFVSGASRHRNSGTRNSAGTDNSRGRWERSLPGRSVPQRPRTTIGRAGAGHGRVLAGEPGQWIPRRVHVAQTCRYIGNSSGTRVGTAAPHRSRGQEQQSSCAAAAARAEIAAERASADRSGCNGRIRSNFATAVRTCPQRGSAEDDNNDDNDTDCDSESKSSAAECVTASTRRIHSGGSASGSVRGILRPRLRRRSSLGDGSCGISDSDSEEEWMAESPSVKLSAERNSERVEGYGTARSKSSSIGKAGDGDARADAESPRCGDHKDSGDSSDVDEEQEETEFEWRNTAPSAVESEKAGMKKSEGDYDGEQPASPTLPRTPLNTRLLQRRQPRDSANAAAAAAATRLSSIASKDGGITVSGHRGARFATDVDRAQEKPSTFDAERDSDDDDDDSCDDEHDLNELNIYRCWSQPRATTPERVAFHQRVGTGVQRGSVGEKRDRETDAGEGEGREARKARTGGGGGNDHKLSHTMSASSNFSDSSSGTGTIESLSGAKGTDDNGDNAQSISALATTSWFNKFRFKGSAAAPRKC